MGPWGRRGWGGAGAASEGAARPGAGSGAVGLWLFRASGMGRGLSVGPPGALSALRPDGARPPGLRAFELRATVPEPRLPPSPQSLEAAGCPSADSEATTRAAGTGELGGPGREHGSRWHPASFRKLGLGRGGHASGAN